MDRHADKRLWLGGGADRRAGDQKRECTSNAHLSTRHKISDRWRGRVSLEGECGSHRKWERGAARGLLPLLVKPRPPDLQNTTDGHIPQRTVVLHPKSRTREPPVVSIRLGRTA